MPPEGHASISVKHKLYDRLGILKRERQRELGVADLTWEQFVEMMALHWERTHRETAGDHRTPHRSRSSNIRGSRDSV